MRIRTRKFVPMKTAIILVFILIPISMLGIYGLQVGKIYEDVVAFSLKDTMAPNESEFIDANYTRLSEMVYETDLRFEKYHMPNNLSSAARFTDFNYSEVNYYYYGDNEALWTGTAFCGWIFKYVASLNENNETMKQDSLRVLRKLIHGLSMLVIVPNGGLGSDYPGILARGYGYPDINEEDDLMNSYYHKSSSGDPQRERHFNGTGDYSDFRWRAYTSNDEYGGYYMALALATKYIQEDTKEGTEIRYIVSQIVDQLCNYMLLTDFQGIHATGGPTGVTQVPKFFSGGFWIPLLMKMGAIFFPEKYERIYYHYVADELTYLHAYETGSQETVSNYYAYNFGHDVILGFLSLEGPNTEIGQKYFQGYLDSAWNNVKYHRNAYFNSIYLALMKEFNNISRGEYQIIERDIEDQLMRMDINHFPDVEVVPKPIPEDFPKVNAIEKWKDYFNNHPYGWFYQYFVPEIRWDEDFYAKPLTVEYRKSHTFMWERNPFQISGGHVNPLVEEAGMSLTVPYWIARANGFILSEGVRI